MAAPPASGPRASVLNVVTGALSANTARLVGADILLSPAADFASFYKTGPQSADTDDIITYTIVAVNTGSPVTDVVLSDALPYTAVFIPGSCTYRRETGLPQACGPLSQMWREDFSTGDRITTTFAVQVTAGSMNWPMVNCAHLSWNGQQISSCWTTRVNPVNRVYLPLMMRNYPPIANCYPYLITEIGAGAYANGVALDTAGRRAFIAQDSGITVVHADTYALITWIPLPSAFGVAYDPDHDRIWVTRINADRVAVLDGTTYAQVADLPAGGEPRYVVYNPTNNRIYVTTKYQGGTVNVYNAASPGYERTLTNVDDPGQIAVNPVTNRIYVANHPPNGQLTVIRGDTHQTYRIASGVFDAFGVTVDTTRNLIYVASVYEGRLSVIDGATEQGLGKIDLRRSDGRKVPLLVLAFNPDLGPEGHLWLVTSSEEPDGEDQVLLIPNGWPTLGTPVPVDLANYPKWGIAIDPVTDRVWVPSVTSALASVVQDGAPVCSVPFSLSAKERERQSEFHITVTVAP
jgi:uncharacterized repeat protein (TIGR01451 family)